MESKTSKQNPPSTPAPPPSTRRPRVREVSSRFMSPISSSSSSSGDLHSLTSNTPKHQIQRSVSAQRLRRQLKMSDGDENHRSSETAARSLDSPFTLLKTGKTSKQKPLKENSNRFDTPTPIRSRLSQHQLGTGSAAAKLLELSIKGQEKSNGSDLLPTLSWRTQQPKVFNSYVPSSPFNRSSSPMRCDGHDSSSYSRIGSTLPPVAPSLKILVDTKKQRKVSEQIEEVHSMKLLHNRYLQWRFANANAEAKTQAQRAKTESMLYSFGLTISQVDNSVEQKRIEVQRLSRVKALSLITESQIPCLEQWSAIEEDYSTSLSQTIQALSNASLRLPLDVDVIVDNRELGEALVAASKAIDGITQNVGYYMSKAQEVESLVSQLARVSDRERSLTEDCRNALRKSQASHIEECSLRSQLIQQTSKEIQVNSNLVLIVEI